MKRKTDSIWGASNWNCHELDGPGEALLEYKRGCACDGPGLLMKPDDVVLAI